MSYKLVMTTEETLTIHVENKLQIAVQGFKSYYKKHD